MIEPDRSQDFGPGKLTPELAVEVRGLGMPANALLEEIAPSMRIYGFGASETQIMKLRRDQCRLKYPEWFAFWGQPKRSEQSRKFVAIIRLVHAYIRSQERTSWIAAGNEPMDFAYKPTIADLQRLSEETIAGIDKISQQDAHFLKEAFGIPPQQTEPAA